ncbi:MAG: hypothetical protein KY462_07720 [Actinobacteria bacterium]|nr:hypothetical protein [Actinomycetota bacterium]
MTVAIVVAAIMVSVDGVLCVARLLRRGSLANRVVALDTLLIAIVHGIAIHAVATRSTVYFDLMVVTALLAFVGTVAVARFIEHGR